FALPMRRSPGPTLFPYTTLFRSRGDVSSISTQGLDVGWALAPERGVPGSERRTTGGGAPLLQLLGDRERGAEDEPVAAVLRDREDRKSTRLNSSHVKISYAVFCL